MKKACCALFLLLLCAGAFCLSEVRMADAARSPSDITVIMYMTDWCPYCVKARQYINSLGVRLVEYNVEREPDKARERTMKSGGRKGVPVIDVEGIVIPGYSPEAIKAAVEQRRNR
jgi:glutaredoxin